MPQQFRTLRHFGLWYELDEQHWLVKYIVLSVILSFTFLLLGAITAYRENFNDLTECIFISLTFVVLSLKLLNLVYRRDAMENLLNEFRVEICRERNAVETSISSKYEKINMRVFYFCIGIALSTGIAFLLIPLISYVGGKHELDFPVKIYEICCKQDVVCYSLVYVFQIFGLLVGIVLDVVTDSMVSGFILLTCRQIDLCCHRFMSSTNSDIQKSVRECVVHQILIRKIVRQLESFLMRMIVPVVLFNWITLCTSIYNLSKTKVSDAESLPFLMYLGYLLTKLFCYCWFGNELKIKSAAIGDSIYNSDWIGLKPLDRKSLFLIMLSCWREMSISLNRICTISLDVFVWVLKTSYAAFNLLKSIEAR